MTSLSPHDRRLTRDLKSVNELKMRSDLIEAVPVNASAGHPPEAWEVTFRCLGIIGVNADRTPVISDYHRVRIELGRDYPRHGPAFRWLTPIWHPNINHQAPYQVCINNWDPGRTLADTILMLGEMVQYKNYHAENTPPGPLDHTVAEWVRWAERQGIVGKNKPVDDRELLRPTRVTIRSSPAAAAPTVGGSRVRITGSGA